jgi:hypothetical protein
MYCLQTLKIIALLSLKRLDLLCHLYSVTSKKTTLNPRHMYHCARDQISRNGKVIPEPKSPRAEDAVQGKGIDLRPQRRVGCSEETISYHWWKLNPIPYLSVPLPSLRKLYCRWQLLYRNFSTFFFLIVEPTIKC